MHNLPLMIHKSCMTLYVYVTNIAIISAIIFIINIIAILGIVVITSCICIHYNFSFL